MELSADQRDLIELARRIKAEQGGEKIKRRMARRIRKALEPAKTEAAGLLEAMDTAGLKRHAEPLRSAVTAGLKIATRMSGRRAGASLRAVKKGMPRGFENAPKRLNSEKGWRHPVPRRKESDGETTWVHQIGAPGWFDTPTQSKREQYRLAVRAAMDETAASIAKGA